MTYRLEAIEGNTAVGGFHVVGTRRARFDVRIEDGSTHTILLNVIHTPDFTMNLISVPKLDRWGLVGAIRGGRLTVSSQDGTRIIDGILTKAEGGRELYKVEVVDTLDKEGDGVIAAIAVCNCQLTSRPGIAALGTAMYGFSSRWRASPS
jgi:hypothetical protein